MKDEIDALYEKIIIFMRCKDAFCKDCRDNDLRICTSAQKEQCFFDFATIAYEVVEYQGTIIRGNK